MASNPAGGRPRAARLDVRFRRERGLDPGLFVPTKTDATRAVRLAWPLPAGATSPGRRRVAPPADSVVHVHVVTPTTSRRLNRDHRGKDKPTNVLSFPDATPPALRALLLETGEPLPLGELFVCASVVADEALAQGKPVLDHWRHMLVHGTLHLQGWDHVHDAEAEAMEATERRLLAALDVTDPYAEVNDAHPVPAGPAAV